MKWNRGGASQGVGFCVVFATANLLAANLLVAQDRVGSPSSQNPENEARAGQAVGQAPGSGTVPGQRVDPVALRLSVLMGLKPDLEAELRDQLLGNLQQQGEVVHADEIKRPLIIQVFETDSEFRQQALALMVARGDLTEDGASQLEQLTEATGSTARGAVPGSSSTSSTPFSSPSSSSSSTYSTYSTQQGTEQPPGVACDDDLGGSFTGQPAIESSGSSGSVPCISSTAGMGTRVPGNPSPSGTASRNAQGMPSGMNREMRTQGAEENATVSTRLQFNPYPTLPSAKDLYRQYADEQKLPLRRFGADLFRPDNIGQREYPMDVPAGMDYVLGPGDVVQIDISGGVSQHIQRVVDREGRLSLPEGGPIVVAGLSLSAAEKAVSARLAGQYRDAHADLSLSRLRTVRIYVAGDVQRPGAYDISSLSTPLNALYAAGGPTASGSMRIVRHMRGTQMLEEFDLYDLLLHGVRRAIGQLLPGDTVLVPPAGPQVTIRGMVKRPAIYELKDAMDISEALEMAGGVKAIGVMTSIEVSHVDAHQRRTMEPVPFRGGAGNTPIVLGKMEIRDGDEVLVRPILPFNQRQIYLEGHVYRPGEYPYADGMTVSDVIQSYADLLPEPSNRAELVRMVPPDFRPITQNIDLASVLAGDQRIPLQPLDTIHVYGRYEFDAPHVAISGEVLKPGIYPMIAGMRVADLVHAAGGVKRSAFLQSAELSSYAIQDGQEVRLAANSIGLDAALAGKGDDNPVLQPGDRLTVKRIPGWQDIGDAITVRGEARFPGTYGFLQGERMSSFLKRIGGFSSYAYPQGAMLSRQEVRVIEDRSREELIARMEREGTRINPIGVNGSDQTNVLMAMRTQQQDLLNRIRSQKSQGRLVIHITANIAEWENTAADIELREGDELTIPKRPNFVLVYGQVYNSHALTYMEHKTGRDYLRDSGGPTEQARKKAIYIIRANGETITDKDSGFFKKKVLDQTLNPGDTLVVPEKIIGTSQTWRTVMETAQVLGAMAITASAVKNF
jgi:protein involved in polysaccharide export with SLBB domain